MYGMKVHRAVIDSDENTSGATVHFVTEVYDEGKVISQITVKRETEDTAEDLASRVFEAEKVLLPLTIDKTLKSELPLSGDEIFTVSYEG